MKKLLVVTAHPDDESFGPGGTIAYYAKAGVEVHVLCATRGEAGDDGVVKSQIPNPKSEKEKRGLHTIREKELLSASKILGVKQVDFLDFIDGTLNNAQYHTLADKIIEKINTFQPQVLITFEPRGVSGHLDHVALSFITTYAYFKSHIPQKLYYYCVPAQYAARVKDYFVYFPPGYSDSEITTRIDVSSVWDQRIEAMHAHQSQMKDVARILKLMDQVYPSYHKLNEGYNTQPTIYNKKGIPKKIESYILRDSRISSKESGGDLFEGIVVD